MAERRQLPPQTRRVELTRRSDGTPIVHHHLTVDTGFIGGRRKQLRRCNVRGSSSCAVVTDG